MSPKYLSDILSNTRSMLQEVRKNILLARANNNYFMDNFFLSTITEWNKLDLIIQNSTGPNPLSANPTKWSNTLKTIRQQQPTNCLRVFDHFVGLTLKRLIYIKVDYYNL